MPSLADVLKAVSETREKYRPLLVAARTERNAVKNAERTTIFEIVVVVRSKP
jgi:hypothetical protein